MAVGPPCAVQGKNMYERIVKSVDYLTENKIKTILRKYLISQGWHAEITQRINNSLDIEATRGDERWIIEVSGLGTPTPDFINSFVSILGELLQRIDDSSSKYSVAFPDTRPFRRLWERLPALAKDRTGITALFVSQAGAVEEITA